jgi:polyisoprenoid-binding protein YceI
MSKFVGRIVISLVLLVAVVYGGILLWTKVINKPEERLGESDLGAVLVTEDSTADDAPNEIEPGDVSGAWTATSESTLGYRVKEVLGGVDTEGVGRTSQVEGEIVLEGTTLTSARFTVDVASITSDSSRRDSQFTGRIMDAAAYPEATFELTNPVDLERIPAAGERITVEVTGDLTLRGTTKSVTFPLTAEYSGTQIAVLGNIEIVFADYGIPNPSNNFVTTGDNGLLEFILVFTRVG